CPLSVHDTATSASYTLSLHDALPISRAAGRVLSSPDDSASGVFCARHRRSNEASPKFDPSHPWRDIPAADSPARPSLAGRSRVRSEEHTSELQSRENLVCRLLLEKKK